MFDSKYGNMLTILLIVLIVIIVGLLAFLGYDIYRKNFISKEATEAMEQFDERFNNKTSSQKNNTEENNTIVGNVTNPYESLNNSTTEQPTNGDNSGGSTIQYKGFNMMGKIKIPRTGIEYPIVDTVTKKSIEVAVAILHGPGLNQVGNTVIVGHNYRNGLFFSNNKKLENGDEIYITDNTGTTIKYIIYNIFITTPEDADYMVRDTNGTREISLSTCTDDSKSRLIICAREE